MIVGIGIDLVSISRIAEKTKNRGFIEKIFSVREIEYCESTTKSSQHFAARFAVKEAFLKATGMGLTKGFDLKDISVEKDELEKPLILLSGAFKEMQATQGWSSIHVSISHEGDHATAIVIIEK